VRNATVRVGVMDKVKVKLMVHLLSLAVHARGILRTDYIQRFTLRYRANGEYYQLYSIT